MSDKSDLPEIDTSDLPDMSADDIQAVAASIPDPSIKATKLRSPTRVPPTPAQSAEPVETVAPPPTNADEVADSQMPDTEGKPNEDQAKKQGGFDAPGIIDDAMRGASVISDLTLGAMLYPARHGRYHFNQAKDLFREEKIGQETFQERIKRKQIQNLADHLATLSRQRAVIDNRLAQREEHFGEYWKKYQNLLHSEAYKREYPDKTKRGQAAMAAAAVDTPIIRQDLEEAIRVEDNSLAELKVFLREHARTLKATQGMTEAIAATAALDAEVDGDALIRSLHDSLDASLGAGGVFERAQTAPSLSEDTQSELKDEAKETMEELKERLEGLIEALMEFVGRVLGR
ncbi:hypothetical protein [Ruegeria atlantica]|uniref:hypothetical protein n=1 Tax=Ruegeria atlantica TaxID=81569 RepID=UPI0024946242|nr:hypothetical protein [Ruegeria atlantica]